MAEQRGLLSQSLSQIQCLQSKQDQQVPLQIPARLLGGSLPYDSKGSQFDIHEQRLKCLNMKMADGVSEELSRILQATPSASPPKIFPYQLGARSDIGLSPPVRYGPLGGATNPFAHDPSWHELVEANYMAQIQNAIPLLSKLNANVQKITCNGDDELFDLDISSVNRCQEACESNHHPSAAQFPVFASGDLNSSRQQQY